jgi:hypothetical protein
MKRSKRLQHKIHALVHSTGFTHHDKLPAVELILQRAVEVIDSFKTPIPNFQSHRTP